eukprot:SAG31_NODE_1530_length_7993_cov_7.079807_2_plen_868_part_00
MGVLAWTASSWYGFLSSSSSGQCTDSVPHSDRFRIDGMGHCVGRAGDECSYTCDPGYEHMGAHVCDGTHFRGGGCDPCPTDTTWSPLGAKCEQCGECLDELWRPCTSFSPTQCQGWESVQDLKAAVVPPGRIDAAAWSLGQDNFMFGGKSAHNISNNDFYELADLWVLKHGHSWQEVLVATGSSPSARAGAVAWSDASRAYVFGGCVGDVIGFNDVWMIHRLSDNSNVYSWKHLGGTDKPETVRSSGSDTFVATVQFFSNQVHRRWPVGRAYASATTIGGDGSLMKGYLFGGVVKYLTIESDTSIAKLSDLWQFASGGGQGMVTNVTWTYIPPHTSRTIEASCVSLIEEAVDESFWCKHVNKISHQGAKSGASLGLASWPSSRYRHAAWSDDHHELLYIFGGLGIGSADGIDVVQLSDLWQMKRLPGWKAPQAADGQGPAEWLDMTPKDVVSAYGFQIEEQASEIANLAHTMNLDYLPLAFTVEHFDNVTWPAPRYGMATWTVPTGVQRESQGVQRESQGASSQRESSTTAYVFGGRAVDHLGSEGRSDTMTPYLSDLWRFDIDHVGPNVPRSGKVKPSSKSWKINDEWIVSAQRIDQAISDVSAGQSEVLRPSARAFSALWVPAPAPVTRISNFDEDHAFAPEQGYQISRDLLRTGAHSQAPHQRFVISFGGSADSGVLNETLVRALVPSVRLDNSNTSGQPDVVPADPGDIAQATDFLRAVYGAALMDYGVVYDYLQCSDTVESDTVLQKWTTKQAADELAKRCKVSRQNLDRLENESFGEASDALLLYLVATVKAEGFLAYTLLADYMVEQQADRVLAQSTMENTLPQKSAATTQNMDTGERAAPYYGHDDLPELNATVVRDKP